MTKKIEDLECEGLVIYQDTSLYRFTSDSVLLANFFKAKKGENVVEFCSGSGVISILGTKKTNAKHFYCFEIQPELAKMAEDSVKLNKIANITIYNKNLSEAPKILGRQTADVVVVNPPYFEGVSDAKNRSIAIATHEEKTNLAQITKTAAELLKFGGKLYMVYPSNRFAELCFQLINNDIQPKRVVFVKPTAEKPANVVLLESVKNGKVGLKVEEIVLNNSAN